MARKAGEKNNVTEAVKPERVMSTMSPSEHCRVVFLLGPRYQFKPRLLYIHINIYIYIYYIHDSQWAEEENLSVKANE